jgi:hypothetical protein
MTKKIFKEFQLCTAVIQGLSTMFIGQMPTFHVIREVHSMLASEFSPVLTICLTSTRNEKAQFKVALRIYLILLFFYSVDK